jgi:hypothetical protein
VTKRILPWIPALADHAEEFVCCDEYGNEDPATWQGRGPDGLPFDPTIKQPALRFVNDGFTPVEVGASVRPVAAPAPFTGATVDPGFVAEIRRTYPGAPDAVSDSLAPRRPKLPPAAARAAQVAPAYN